MRKTDALKKDMSKNISQHLFELGEVWTKRTYADFTAAAPSDSFGAYPTPQDTGNLVDSIRTEVPKKSERKLDNTMEFSVGVDEKVLLRSKGRRVSRYIAKTTGARVMKKTPPSDHVYVEDANRNSNDPSGFLSEWDSIAKQNIERTFGVSGS